LVSEDSVVDTSLARIAGDRARASEAERERTLRRVGAGAAVVLVHIVILLALFTAGKFEALRHKPQPQEVMLLFPPPAQHTKTNTAPVVVTPQLVPKEQVQAPKFTITVPPPKPEEQQQQKPGDVMEAIGKDLACGAGPWEHLSQAQREACKRNPWKFKKTAKGVIVMDVPDKAPVAEEPTTGSDQELHTLQTSDPCLAAGNTHSECIHKTIFGR
jgi:hypothetical protein